VKTTLIFFFMLALLSSPLATFAAKPLDFDGDGKSDFAVIRNRTSGSNTVIDWYIAQSSTNILRHAQWGLGPADIPLPADYDGDNKTDIAVWRSSSTIGQSYFYILNSSNATVRVEQFGLEFDETRVVGDYDGDNKADLAVYRQSGFGQQTYFIYRGSLNNPNGNLTYVPWGTGSSTIYPGDFDGDGKYDFCVRQPGTGRFALLRSSDGGVEWINWGLPNDGLNPGDYDGDGKTDFCARRTNGTAVEWYILERDGGGTGAAPIRWGRTGVPIQFPIRSGDYDGDGLSDIGVYQIGDGQPGVFFIRRSSDGSTLAYQLGTSDAGDAPL